MNTEHLHLLKTAKYQSLALIPTAYVTADNIDEPEFDVPDDVESVFEELFAGLQDKVDPFSSLLKFILKRCRTPPFAGLRLKA